MSTLISIMNSFCVVQSLENNIVRWEFGDFIESIEYLILTDVGGMKITVINTLKWKIAIPLWEDIKCTY